MSFLSHIKDDTAEWWRRFWGQPNKAYRNFHLAFFLLAVHFIIPSISYALDPAGTVKSLNWIGGILGADTRYQVKEFSYVWRVLAVANVFTLGFMCLYIESNVRRFYAALLPLCVLKACASLGFLVVYLTRYHYPAFLAVSLWDATNVLMFLYFAHTAYWSLEEFGEETAVPRLFFRD